MFPSNVVSFSNISFQVVKLVHLLSAIFNSVAVKMCVRLQILPLALTNPGPVKIEILTTRFTFPQ